jgi:peptidoglycan hydrolase CwlO-like protein
MPTNKLKTYGDVVVDLNRLLVTVNENEGQLPDMSREKTELETALGRIDNAQARQNFHTSERQKATQDLTAALTQGQEVAKRIRAAAKFKLGAYNEKLVQFRVSPLRPRRKPPKPPDPPPPTLAAVQAPDPDQP